MKSKHAKIIISALICVFLLFGSACNNSENETNTDSAKTEVLLNSFESYQDVYNFATTGTLKFNFVSDEDSVTDGKKAGQIVVGEKDDDSEETASIAVPLMSSDGQENYRDFSKAVKLTYDVYNPSENIITLSTALMQKKANNSLTNGVKTILQPNEKATVSFPVNKFELFYSFGIDKVTHVNISVTGIRAKANIDNLRLFYNNMGFSAPELSQTGKEILTFEKAYDEFLISTTGTVFQSEIVTDAATASEGFRYLKINRNGYQDGELTDYYSGQLHISSGYLSKVNWDAFGDSYIAFDCKLLWTGGTYTLITRLVSIEKGGYANTSVKIPCDDEWHTVCIPLKFAPYHFDNIQLWAQYSTKGGMAFDNFRIEEMPPNGAIVVDKYST